MNGQRFVPSAADTRGQQDLDALAAQASWEFDGITVSQAEVHLWMASVGHKVPDGRYWYYVKWYGVPAKIAHAKSRGLFERVVAEASLAAGIVISVASTPHQSGDRAPSASSLVGQPGTTVIHLSMPAAMSAIN